MTGALHEATSRGRMIISMKERPEADLRIPEVKVLSKKTPLDLTRAGFLVSEDAFAYVQVKV
jgi:hypothetical protein